MHVRSDDGVPATACTSSQASHVSMPILLKLHYQSAHLLLPCHACRQSLHRSALQLNRHLCSGIYLAYLAAHLSCLVLVVHSPAARNTRRAGIAVRINRACTRAIVRSSTNHHSTDTYQVHIGTTSSCQMPLLPCMSQQYMPHTQSFDQCRRQSCQQNTADRRDLIFASAPVSACFLRVHAW